MIGLRWSMLSVSQSIISSTDRTVPPMDRVERLTLLPTTVLSSLCRDPVERFHHRL
eukprot:COSAG02_NODE_13714_length_1358_cov_1.015091_2_plen_55_part_01